MRRGLFMLMSIILMAILFGGCVGHQEGVVAKVGKFTITTDDLEKTMRPRKYKSYDEELQKRKDSVERLATEKLFLAAAYEQELDKDEDIVADLAKTNPQRLSRVLYKIVVTDKAIDPTEDKINQAYARMKTKIHAKHILVENEKLADSLYKALQNGANFDTLANEFTIDPSGKGHGGDLRLFSAMEMIQPFEDAAYALEPGQISKPVKTRFGWHIIKVIEKIPNDQIKPLEQERDKIIAHLKRGQETKLAQDFIEKIKSDANFKFNTDNVKLVVQRYAQMMTDTLNPITALPFSLDDKKLPLASYKYGNLTINDLDTTFRKIPPTSKPKFVDEKSVEDFIRILPQQLLIEKAAEELNVKNDEYYKELYDKEITGKIVAKFRKDFLFKDLNVGDDEVKAFYDANPDSFIDSTKVHAIEIQVGDEKQAKNLIKKIKNGADIKELAKKYTERTYLKDKGGDLGYFNSQRYPNLYKAAMTLKPGEVYPEPINIKNKYSVIKLIDVKPPERKQFEQVKSRIRSNLLTKLRKDFYENWIEQAKKKYSYKIFDDEIAKTIDQSKYENDTTAKPPATKDESK
ncbi:peptidylprolyl isomerase [bacterium]|nr:peptidylprolyl isomerase [bacterium]